MELRLGHHGGLFAFPKTQDPYWHYPGSEDKIK